CPACDRAPADHSPAHAVPGHLVHADNHRPAPRWITTQAPAAHRRSRAGADPAAVARGAVCRQWPCAAPGAAPPAPRLRPAPASPDLRTLLEDQERASLYLHLVRHAPRLWASTPGTTSRLP